MPSKPQMNLNPAAMAWGRWMERRIDKLEQDADRRAAGEKRAASATKGTREALRDALRQVLDAQAQLAAMQTDIVASEKRLTSLSLSVESQQNYISPLVTTENFGDATVAPVMRETWATSNRPTVTIRTPSGRVRVTVTATLLTGVEGMMVATYSIPGTVERTGQIGYILGTGTGLHGLMATTRTTGSFSQVVQGLPTDVPITVNFECYSSGADGGFLSPSVSVDVLA